MMSQVEYVKPPVLPHTPLPTLTHFCVAWCDDYWFDGEGAPPPFCSPSVSGAAVDSRRPSRARPPPRQLPCVAEWVCVREPGVHLWTLMEGKLLEDGACLSSGA